MTSVAGFQYAPGMFALQISSDQTLAISTSVLASATIALAIVTYFYLKETKLMRKSAQNPSFALEPTVFTASGDFHGIRLANTGQSANDVFVDCSWNGSTQGFHILSLSKDGRASLEIPITEIVEKKKKLTVRIRCKDAGGQSYETTLEIDFRKATAENRVLSYQYSPWESIVQRLEDIERRFR